MSEAADNLDLRGQRTRIDHMLADIELKLIQAQQTKALEPWKVGAICVTAAAALFTAGAGFVKLMGG